MKSWLSTISTMVEAGLKELNQQSTTPTISVNVVEVTFTLLPKGSSEMWVEEYVTLAKMKEDFNFFSRYRGKSIIRVYKRGSDLCIAAYEVNKYENTVTTLVGDTSFANIIKANLLI